MRPTFCVETKGRNLIARIALTGPSLHAVSFVAETTGSLK